MSMKRGVNWCGVSDSGEYTKRRITPRAKSEKDDRGGDLDVSSSATGTTHLASSATSTNDMEHTRDQ